MGRVVRAAPARGWPAGTVATTSPVTFPGRRDRSASTALGLPSVPQCQEASSLWGLLYGHRVSQSLHVKRWISLWITLWIT